MKARKLEMDYFQEMGVYSKIRREKGMKVISTKWIDTNKGDNVSPNYRSRLVGRELALTKRDDIFAATPPLEAKHMLV